MTTPDTLFAIGLGVALVTSAWGYAHARVRSRRNAVALDSAFNAWVATLPEADQRLVESRAFTDALLDCAEDYGWTEHVSEDMCRKYQLALSRAKHGAPGY